MPHKNEKTNLPVTAQAFADLDKDRLIDLLQIKTKQLIDARAAKITDRHHIESLHKEVEDIQNEVKSRMS